jgi:hypothetical protein
MIRETTTQKHETPARADQSRQTSADDAGTLAGRARRAQPASRDAVSPPGALHQPALAWPFGRQHGWRGPGAGFLSSARGHGARSGSSTSWRLRDPPCRCFSLRSLIHGALLIRFAMRTANRGGNCRRPARGDVCGCAGRGLRDAAMGPCCSIPMSQHGSPAWSRPASSMPTAGCATCYD